MGDGELSDLVARAYAAAFDREQWQSYLEKLRDSTGASTAFLVSADLSGNSADGLDGPLIPDESNRLYRDHFHAIDEFALAYMRSGLGPGRTWSSHQLIPDARLAATEFYNGFLRRFDYFYTAGGILFQDGPSMIGLGVLRSRRQGPPDREALRLLTALMPHHQHTVRIAQRLRQLEAATRINDALADALPYGVIALDRHRRMTAMNSMAAEIVNARDGLCAGPAGLFALRAREDRTLQSAIAAALSRAARGSTVQLPRPRHLQPLHVVITPVPHASRSSALDDLAAAVLLFVHDPTRRAMTPLRMLRELYGLSRQQARLSALLGSGASLAQCAEQLGIARETAVSHLKEIFRKTGVRRQSS
jgi:DNA-binding CsgD family transcriptional regulator